VTAANNFINRRDSAEDEIGKKIRKLIGRVLASKGGFDRQEFADHLHIQCDIEERKTIDMHFDQRLRRVFTRNQRRRLVKCDI
jgi:hypothetical protein